MSKLSEQSIPGYLDKVDGFECADLLAISNADKPSW